MWSSSTSVLRSATTLCPRLASTSTRGPASRAFVTTLQRYSRVRGESGVSVDSHVQSLLREPKSRLPQFVNRLVVAAQLKFGKDNVDPHYKSLLDRASAQLYFDCANKFDYAKLCESLGLGDFVSSWYKLTLMHTWMLQLRLHVSLDADAYFRLQRGLLATMWTDIDQRLKIVGEEINQTLTSQADMQHMHGLHLQTFLEYDEGFLGSDAEFAAAVWRCLYVGRHCEPVQVRRAVAYMRATVAWLDTLDLQDILVEGIPEWKQLRPATAAKEVPRRAVVEKPEAQPLEEIGKTADKAAVNAKV